MSGDIFGCYSCRGATGIYWIEVKDVAKHPTTHRTVPYDKELSSLKCQ